MAEKALTTRRGLFGGALVLAALSAGSALPATAHANIFQEIRAVKTLRQIVNAPGSPDAVCAEWEHRSAALYSRVEALPLTPENARIRLAALREITEDDLNYFVQPGHNETTEQRLSRQLVATMLGAL